MKSIYIQNFKQSVLSLTANYNFQLHRALRMITEIILLTEQKTSGFAV